MEKRIIPKEKFKFVENKNIHDAKFKTKPVGYFKDAWRRFKKNKASVTGAIIIISLILFSIITPIFAPFKVNFLEGRYRNMVPKNEFLAKFGIATGIKEVTSNAVGYERRLALGAASEDKDGTLFNNIHTPQSQWKNTTGVLQQYGKDREFSVVKSDAVDFQNGPIKGQKFKIDTYMEVGFTYYLCDWEDIEEIVRFQVKSGIQVLYPAINRENTPNSSKEDANFWYATDAQGNVIRDASGSYVSNYLLDQDGKVRYYDSGGSEGVYRIRVLYYNYFKFVYDETPQFLLGTNEMGQDLLIRVAKGIQTSLLIAVFVASINLIIGAIIGALEGYYGGWFDLLMERVQDVLGGLPFMVIVTLFKLHLVDTGKVSSLTALLFVFVSTGWMGMAGLVRRQFYRFKSHEYVLAARTLGASDLRLMSKHIFPNGIGSIITSSVLVIPSVIFGESSLSYLGILNISGRDVSSLGAILGSGQQSLMDYPHVILWPSIVISLLMISFNLFGNGLRDAFNPSLRGVEE